MPGDPPLIFADRRDAGRRLGAALVGHPALAGAERVVVLAIPRGGLPVGAEVARALGAALDVVVVRKIRAPHNPELGVGAVGPDGFADVDEGALARLRIRASDLEREIADRRAVVAERVARYREAAPAADVSGGAAVVVDDGVATGGTARRACAAARRLGATTVVLAVPVGPPRLERELAGVADAVVVLSTPIHLLAVGQAYRDFTQVPESDALEILRAARA